MSDIKNLTKKVIKFRDDRDWKQFHNPKNCATHLMIEASEVMQVFAWEDEKELSNLSPKLKAELGDELSDVLGWILILAHDNNINLVKAFEKKLKHNIAKYPIEKSKGNRKKYTQLE